MSLIFWVLKHSQNSKKLPAYHLSKLPSDEKKQFIIHSFLDCPIDGKDINVNRWGIKSFLTDTQILQQIQSQNYQTNSQQEIIRFTFSAQPKTEQNKLFQQSSYTKQKLWNYQLCKVHMKKADFVCKKDFKIACSLCINLGQNLRDQFVSYEQLIKQLSGLTDQTFRIHESLNNKSQKLTKRNIDNFIEQQIMKKKERQAYDIRTYFQGVIQKIRKQEKIILENLQLIASDNIKILKSKIDTNTFRNRKQVWSQEVHKLVLVMEDVYNWTGFKESFQYLNNQEKRFVLIDHGKRLMEELSLVNQSINDLVREHMKKLECSFDQKFIIGIKSLCQFGLPQSDVHQDQERVNQARKQLKIPVDLKICHTFSQTVMFDEPLTQRFIFCKPQKQSSNFKNQEEQEDQQKVQNSDNQLQQSSQQDFLLDTQKSSFQHDQTLTKNQITFEQDLTLQNNKQLNSRQKFTPILRKQQDQMSILQDQSTIINLNNKKQQQSPLIYTQSNDITIKINPINSNKNISLSCQKIPNPSEELSKTCVFSSINKRQRTPLKSLNSNITQSQKKKLGIPQKYIPVWQSAKHDNSEMIDFTGAQIGDNIALILANHLAESKQIKSVKLIRNKLTDNCIPELILRVTRSNVSSLNLSQNMLTQKALNLLQTMDLGKLKSITLSLNKIVLRKVRDRIEKFKEKGITLTV